MTRRKNDRPVVTIRRARQTDLDAVDTIEKRSFGIDRFPKATLKRFLTAVTAESLVAESDAKVAGYVVILFRARAQVARLYSMAVDPACRGRGVAQGLLAAAEDTALKRGSRAIRLEVRASNKAALGLYERAGYTFLERKRGYYQDGEDGLRLEKRLGPRKAGGRRAPPDAQ